MNNCISYSARNIIVQGLNQKALPSEPKMKEYFFPDDYEKLQLLRSIPPFTLTELQLLYPGAGVDILFPLHYCDWLFPKITTAKFIFVDKDDNMPIIKTILDDVRVSFAETKDAIQFFWKGKLIELKYVQGDIFDLVEQFQFNIYFEKAFRIIKSYHHDYEHKIVKQLDSGGIIISDSGFENVPLRKIEVSPELSSYGEMVIGVK